MSTTEVVKKRGRPKRIIGEPMEVEETSVVKPKKPRTTRKSGATSPIEKPESRIIIKHDGPPSILAKVIKETKTRPAKSVAVEKPSTSVKAVKASSKQPEPSIILQQATAFAEAERNEPPPKFPESVKGEWHTRLKEFKAAGTLPNIKDVKKPSDPSTSSLALASSHTTKSLFLADFLTEPPSADQPAWSRPKKPATVSAPVPHRSPSSRDPVLEALAPPRRPNTASLLSASPLPTTPDIPVQGEQASQAASSEVETPTKAPAGAPIQAAMPARPLRPMQAPVQAPTPNQTHAPTPKQSPPRQHRLNIPNIPRVAPQPLKPTQMPYEVLKRDPKFKSLSRRYTALIVSIPILLATSYTLYGRYTEMMVQRRSGTDEDTTTINGGV